MAVQTQEKHRQRVALRFVEHGEEFTAAKETERGNIVKHIEKAGRRRREHETQHEQRPRLVHVTQEPMEGHAKTDENYLPDEIAEDRQSKQRLVRENRSEEHTSELQSRF